MKKLATRAVFTLISAVVLIGCQVDLGEGLQFECENKEDCKGDYTCEQHPTYDTKVCVAPGEELEPADAGDTSSSDTEDTTETDSGDTVEPDTDDPDVADSGSDTDEDTSGCSDNLTRCNGECVDTETDLLHCGGCGRTCTAPPNDDSITSCEASECVYACEPGFSDSNEDWTDVDDPPASTDGCDIECVETNGGREICDGVDNNCDGDIDETFDNLGDSCTEGQGICANRGSIACDPSDASKTTCDASPDTPEDEVCGDNTDNDCDGATDEPDAVDAEVYFADCDNDGYAASGAISMRSCISPTSPPSDCPGGSWTTRDPSDPNLVDCADDNPEQSPGKQELCLDGIDNDCDGTENEDDATDAMTWYPDVDGDGFGDDSQAYDACEPNTPTDVDEGSDCDDTDEFINPDALDTCDGINNDCDTETDEGPFQADLVAAGETHTCAIDLGILHCWGSNLSGQLGTGNTNGSDIPLEVAPGMTFTQVDAGRNFTCALTDLQEVYCWGQNSQLQLGDGTTRSESLVPVQVDLSAFSPAPLFTDITVGESHACALSDQDDVYCWGDNSSSQVGSAFGANVGTPKKINSSELFQVVDAGGNHTCAINGVDEVYCWGQNSRLQCGQGGTTNVVGAPTQVSLSDPPYELGLGGGHTCAATDPNGLKCWGSNRDGSIVTGQLGIDDSTITQTPTPTSVVTSATGPWAIVDGGSAHTCAVNDNFEAYCWGANASGQLGDDSFTDRFAPVQVSGGMLFSIGEGAIDAGKDHSCGITDEFALYCWGDNRFGRLGTGAGPGSGGVENTPQPVACP